MEERMMLFARGTASGYSGALAQVTGVSAASPVAATGQTALASGTYFAVVTADAGISANGFGESIASAIVTETVNTGGGGGGMSGNPGTSCEVLELLTCALELNPYLLNQQE